MGTMAATSKHSLRTHLWHFRFKETITLLELDPFTSSPHQREMKLWGSHSPIEPASFKPEEESISKPSSHIHLLSEEGPHEDRENDCYLKARKGVLTSRGAFLHFPVSMTGTLPHLDAILSESRTRENWILVLESSRCEAFGILSHDTSKALGSVIDHSTEKQYNSCPCHHWSDQSYGHDLFLGLFFFPLVSDRG